MTQEQLNRGKEIQEEISCLEGEISTEENALSMSDFPFGRKEEEISCGGLPKSIFKCKTTEYKSFLESLIKTRKDKIKELEQEFEKL